MAKNRRSLYQPGLRTLTWQKIKIRPEQELVVGGWTTGIGSATDLAALLVGVYDDGELRYAGKIGTGFTCDKRAELLALLPSLGARRHRSPRHLRAPPRGTRSGCVRSSSSVLSSRAGPAMAWFARQRTRASTGERNRARFAENSQGSRFFPPPHHNTPPPPSPPPPPPSPSPSPPPSPQPAISGPSTPGEPPGEPPGPPDP